VTRDLELIASALKTLGADATPREIQPVAEALDRYPRSRAVLTDAASHGPGYQELIELATACGSSAFVALDVVIAAAAVEDE
jgi:hypothetical protein